MKNKLTLILSLLILSSFGGCGQSHPAQQVKIIDSKIIPGAERPDIYLPLLKTKRVAVFANNTSMVGNVHLVDTLTRMGVDVKKIFAPEHGFRGTADAGEHVGNTKDEKTGITVISLYGKKRKPSTEDLADVDVIVFDIQDVGTRFFTYISSLEDLCESAIENNKPLIILDRPNPNGFYVDGPVLKKGYRSFLGMQKIPVVYGMTIGEYAKMLNGENWIDSAIRKKAGRDVDLTIIPCKNYDHNSKYILPVRPSPNLPDMASVYLYPSTCFFEGTLLSEGRGTDRPFQMFGHPKLPDTLQSFTPRSRVGATSPKQMNNICYGWDLGGTNEEVLKKIDGKVRMKWLINAYSLFPGKDTFFINKGSNLNRLAGNNELISQIKNGDSEEWGYHLLDLQVNDITFDKAIIESMSRVVASNNLKAAAENEGQALLITKTKAAEADGNSIKIAAEAEREAARLRGQGVALFRQEVAKGMTEAAEQMKAANLDTNVILFSMWTEAIKNFAEYGKGNVIFLDGSPDGMEHTMKQIQAMMLKQSGTSKN